MLSFRPLRNMLSYFVFADAYYKRKMEATNKKAIFRITLVL
nr:unnamed protein product [Callosobruchus chinensis]